MHRSTANRIVLLCSALLLLVALRVWGWRPIADPDTVENGSEEVRLAPQRIPAPPAGVTASAGKIAVFGGNPYLVGSIVTPTAETNITINPVNERNLVAIITDYSERSGGISSNGASKYAISNDYGVTWGQAFVPLSGKYPITSDGIKWLVDRDPGVAIDLAGNVYFSGLYLKLAPGQASAAVNPPIARQTTPGGVYVCAGTLPEVVS